MLANLLDVRFSWDDYRNGNSLDALGRARQDRRFELRAGVQKNLARSRLVPWGQVSLRLDYTFIDNDSNILDVVAVRPYDYARHIVSSQTIVSF